MPLSNKQMEYLALAWACFESEPKIDYEKFRQVAGLASANSARELMRVTKKKLHAEYGTISDSVHTAASKNGEQNGAATPKKAPAKDTIKKQAKASSKRKKAKVEADAVDSPLSAVAGAEMEDDDDDSPSKRARTMSPNAEHIKQEPQHEGGDYDDGYHG